MGARTHLQTSGPLPLFSLLAQDASVHEILENGELVGRVLGELGGTLRLLDDLEENLAVFDARLRHMREDIAGACTKGAGLCVFSL